MKKQVFSFCVWQDESGIWLAREEYASGDAESSTGAGDTPMQALACLCAVIQAAETGKELPWQDGLLYAKPQERGL